MPKRLINSQKLNASALIDELARLDFRKIQHFISSNPQEPGLCEDILL